MGHTQLTLALKSLIFQSNIKREKNGKIICLKILRSLLNRNSRFHLANRLTKIHILGNQYQKNSHNSYQLLTKIQIYPIKLRTAISTKFTRPIKLMRSFTVSKCSRRWSAKHRCPRNSPRINSVGSPRTNSNKLYCGHPFLKVLNQPSRKDIPL